MHLPIIFVINTRDTIDSNAGNNNITTLLSATRGIRVMLAALAYHLHPRGFSSHRVK